MGTRRGSRRNWTVLGLFAVVGAALVCGGQRGQEALAPNLAAACYPGQLLIAQPGPSDTRLTLYDYSHSSSPERRDFRLGDVAVGLTHRGRDGLTLCWSKRDAYLLRPAEARTYHLWRSEHPILQLLEVRPPHCEGSRVLALTAEDLSGAQALTSHLYLLDPTGRDDPCLLSPGSRYNFWAVSAGDVDGNGAEDIALCTWSCTVRDPEYARRFFVYSWDDKGDLYPRWRGSRLCRPYLAAFLGLVGDDPIIKLVSIELGPDGGQLLVAYQWNQFGFWGIGHSSVIPRMQSVQFGDVDADGDIELVTIVTNEDGGRRPLAVDHSAGRIAVVGRGRPLEQDQAIAVVPGARGAIVLMYARYGDPVPQFVHMKPVREEVETSA